MKQVSYSILTYIFNNGDWLREAPKDDNIEYICVTDNPNLKSDTWKIIVDEDLKGKDPEYASFYVRYHPFKYCKGNICIRIDGSIKINKSLLPIFEEFDKSNNDVCVMVNPRAKNIRWELFWWIQPRFKEVKSKQVKLYKNLGVDINSNGVLQSPISITRNNDICNECDSKCWELIEQLSTDKVTARPSQVIMTVALYLTKDIKKMFVDESFIHTDYLQWYSHNSNFKRNTVLNMKHEDFFGEPIKIHKFKCL